MIAGLSVAMGHFRVTTMVVVVIDIYLYNYYYHSGHFQLTFGMGSQGLKKKSRRWITGGLPVLG